MHCAGPLGTHAKAGSSTRHFKGCKYVALYFVAKYFVIVPKLLSGVYTHACVYVCGGWGEVRRDGGEACHLPL